MRQSPYLTAVVYDLFREAIRAEACRIDLSEDGTITFYDEHDKGCPIAPCWTTLCDDWEFEEQLAKVLIQYFKSMGGVASPHSYYPQSGRFIFHLPFGGVEEQIGCSLKNTPARMSEQETLHINMHVRPWINPFFLVTLMVALPSWTGYVGFTNGVSSLYAWTTIVLLHIGFLILPKVNPEQRLLGRALIFVLILHTALMSFCIGSWIGDWFNESDLFSTVGMPIIGAILMSIASKTYYYLKERGTDTRRSYRDL